MTLKVEYESKQQCGLFIYIFISLLGFVTKDKKDDDHPARLQQQEALVPLSLPAASHTVRSHFPQEPSEGGGFTGTQQGREAARVGGSIPCAAQRARGHTMADSFKIFTFHVRSVKSL